MGILKVAGLGLVLACWGTGAAKAQNKIEYPVNCDEFKIGDRDVPCKAKHAYYKTNRGRAYIPGLQAGYDPYDTRVFLLPGDKAVLVFIGDAIRKRGSDFMISITKLVYYEDKTNPWKMLPPVPVSGSCDINTAEGFIECNATDINGTDLVIRLSLTGSGQNVDFNLPPKP